MIWLIVFAIIILGATASAVYVLTLLDQIVNSELYNYGLQFSLEWANPYWTFLRITLALLSVATVFAAACAVLTFTKYVYAKKPSGKPVPSQKPLITVPTTTRTVEKVSTMPIAPPLTHAPPTPPTLTHTPTQTPMQTSSDAPLSSEIPGLMKCSHCGKAFTQPLRMLDFQGDRPRIVNICPFCNEIIPPTPRQDQNEQGRRFSFRKKNNNHAPKAVASHPVS